MDPLTLGVALAVLGMGGTLTTLVLLALIMVVLKRVFPAKQPENAASPAAQTPTTATPGPQ